MKSCPKCNRTFPDEGQKFCTFDGGLLIAPQTFDPNATIRATSIDLNAASERPTSRDLPDPNATMIESYPATVALPRNTGPTGAPTGAPNTADIAKPAPPPPPPPPPPPAPPTPSQVSQPLPQPQAPPPAPLPALPQAVTPSAPLPAPPAAQKKSKMPWIIVGVLLFLLLGGGVLAGAFFFIVKPRLDQVSERRDTEPVVRPTIETAPSPVISQPSPSPEDSFVPPPNAVQFQNSDANLDGKLAEHYFDFSFYYPKTWQRDPKAGIAGATNFVKVERSLPPNFIQENFAVGWYTSTGTFAGDRQNFPQRVEEYSAALAKAFDDYRKVSEGPTKINSLDAYEFRWEGLAKGTEKGDVHLWGRVVFLPTGNEGDSAGATLSMLSTSLAPELSSVEDIGQKGEATVILDSFRFGKK
jgi:hypothetical protein